MQTATIIAYDIETTWPEISTEEVKKGKEERKFSMAVSCNSILPEKYSE